MLQQSKIWQNGLELLWVQFIAVIGVSCLHFCIFMMT